ncbi:MAG: transcriptional regulator [Candidatus Thorarchaeota archaeon]|jgi:predicted Zn-ribbon and HTH transcriptional regulator
MTLRLKHCVQNIEHARIAIRTKDVSEIPTRREKIAEMLERTEYPLTAEDICRELDIKDRSIVYEDITHISKSIKNESKELLVQPARCGNCDFIFKVKGSAKRPSKCPKCRGQWIISPGYLIRNRK